MASADNDDWKPNSRPKSTLALNFSNDLDNTFGMSNTDSGLDGLAKAVEQKYSPLPLITLPLSSPTLPSLITCLYPIVNHASSSLKVSPFFFSRKQALDSQSAELEALNARLKETEERLQKKSNGNNPQAAAGAGAGAGKKVTTPRKTFSPTAQHQQQQKLDAFSSSSLSSSTMNYWRSGGGGGSQNETTTGGGAPQTPSEMTRDMPGGFDGH